MAKNTIQPGDVLDLTAPSGGVTAGICYKIGTLIVLAVTTAAVGEKFAAQTVGVISYAKAASQAWTEGAAVYWDDTAKNFTTTVGSNTKAGVAVEVVAGGAGDTTGKIRLNGVGA
jgi:predicted RecA/RadA family phage recombinase